MTQVADNLPTMNMLAEPRKLAADERVDRPWVYDCTMEQYHGDLCVGPSASSSVLRTVWSQSPAHAFMTSYLNPLREDQGERPHFSLGRAAHHLLFLGRRGFDRLYAIRPDKWSDWRTKAAQEWKTDKIGGGYTILTDNELFQIAGMAGELSRHPLVKAGILDGYVERSLVYKDEATGIWVKTRPDCVPNDSGDYADLKTTVSVNTDSLARTIATFGYHMQGALVGSASRAVLDRELVSFTLVFVEPKPPHCTRVITLKPADLALGERQNAAALQMFAAGANEGRWPGPGGHTTDAEYLDLPGWYAQRTEARLQLIGQGYE